jgi:hypothetical protein
MATRSTGKELTATLALLGVAAFTSACSAGQPETNSPSYQAGYHEIVDHPGWVLLPAGQVDTNYVCRDRMNGLIGASSDEARLGLNQPTTITDKSAFRRGCMDGFHAVLDPHGYTFGADGIARALR